jgi:hypothetical protein
MTQQVPWMDLVSGKQYRIENIIEGGEPPLLGTFDKSYSYPIRRQYSTDTKEVAAIFNNLKKS